MTVGNYTLASVGNRFIALVIDYFILLIIFAILREAGGIISFIVGAGYNWYFLTRNNGQTLGKQMMNVRVIKVDGSPLTDADAIIRYVGYYINTAVLFLGWIWAFFDENNQGWHDKIAQTYVVQA